MSNINTIKEFAAQVLAAENMVIGDPIIIEENTFVPVIKKVIAREERDYLTLSEALKENYCKIIDKGNEVNHILFQNKCDIPILIEEGEIFQGEGTQDRISVGTVMVKPHTEVEISVKCVHAPHHLSAGADFSYGGKCSRGMLNELRVMKYANATTKIPASQIDQSRVWNKVSEENEEELSGQDPKYMKSIKNRQKRAKNRSASVEFPENTIGVIVLDADGQHKGMEIHRSPHNFNIRKEGIFESVEANIKWEKTGKGPVKKPKAKAREIFEKITNLKEGKEALKQVEIDGLAINLDGISGEAFTATFYAAICPECNESKPRQKSCPHCGNVEEESDEVAYMSLM